MRHVLLFPHCLTVHADDDVLCIDTKQLRNWRSSRRVRVRLEWRTLEYDRVGWKRVPFQAQMVDKEPVEELNHVIVVHFYSLSTIIYEIQLIAC